MSWHMACIRYEIGADIPFYLDPSKCFYFALTATCGVSALGYGKITLSQLRHSYLPDPTGQMIMR